MLNCALAVDFFRREDGQVAVFSQEQPHQDPSQLAKGTQLAFRKGDINLGKLFDQQMIG